MGDTSYELPNAIIVFRSFGATLIEYNSKSKFLATIEISPLSICTGPLISRTYLSTLGWNVLIPVVVWYFTASLPDTIIWAGVYWPDISRNPIVPILRLTSSGYAPPPIDKPHPFGVVIFINVFEDISFDIKDAAEPVVATFL